MERNRERAAEQKKEAESLREKIAEKAKTEKSEETPAEKSEEEQGVRRKDDTEETEDRNEKQSYTITELSQEKDNVQEDVKRELNKLGLTGEDAKGVAVDKYI